MGFRQSCFSCINIFPPIINIFIVKNLRLIKFEWAKCPKRSSHMRPPVLRYLTTSAARLAKRSTNVLAMSNFASFISSSNFVSMSAVDFMPAGSMMPVME